MGIEWGFIDSEYRDFFSDGQEPSRLFVVLFFGPGGQPVHSMFLSKHCRHCRFHPVVIQHGIRKPSICG